MAVGSTFALRSHCSRFRRRRVNIGQLTNSPMVPIASANCASEHEGIVAAQLCARLVGRIRLLTPVRQAEAIALASAVCVSLKLVTWYDIVDRNIKSAVHHVRIRPTPKETWRTRYFI